MSLRGRRSPVTPADNNSTAAANETLLLNSSDARETELTNPATNVEETAKHPEANPAKADPGDPLPGRNVVFGVVSMALMMSSIDATIVGTALHTIGHDLHSTINWTGWTITAYSIGRLMAVPMMGKIGDKYGRRRIFLGSVALFTVSSLACGLSTSIYELVALRFVQSLGGAAFMPSVTGIVAQRFGRDRDRAIALFNSIISIGGIIGPIFGGLFVAYWSWRGIFLINVPIGAVLIVAGLRVIPETTRKATEPTDVRGIALFGSLLMCLVLGVTLLGSNNVKVFSPEVIIPVLAGFTLMFVFAHHIRTTPFPLLPPRFFVGKGFLTVNTVNFMFGAGALGFAALVPLYAQDRYHIQVLSSGTLLTARGVGIISVSVLSALAIRRLGVRPLMLAGFTVTGFGLLLIASAPHFGLGDYEWLAISAAITGIGFGLANPATSNAGLRLAPDQLGSLSGLRSMFRFSGQILAVSLTTAILNRSAQPGIAESHVFFVFGLMLFITLPVIAHIKDTRGRW